MHRTESDNNLAGLFTNGPPATTVAADWCNAVQEELINFVLESGLVPDTAATETQQQLKNALDTLLAAAIPSGGGAAAQVRNLVNNGAMRVAQRGTSFGPPLTTQTPTLDLWKWTVSGVGQVQVTQTTTVPSGEGLANSLKIDVTTADAALTTTDHYGIIQYLEAQNLQHLLYGQGGAKSLTLSFWVRSNVTGQMGGFLQQLDGARVWPFGYTINVADTWEEKTIVISGDTSGTINNDNGQGFRLEFSLGYGSTEAGGTVDQWQADAGNLIDPLWNTNVMASTSNEFYLTGVLLEVKDAAPASDYPHLFFAEELRQCQRYYRKSYDYGTSPGTITGTGAYDEQSIRNIGTQMPGYRFSPEMRDVPTITLYSYVTGTSGRVYNAADRVATAANIGEQGFPYVSVTGGVTGNDCWAQFGASADL